MLSASKCVSRARGFPHSDEVGLVPRVVRLNSSVQQFRFTYLAVGAVGKVAVKTHQDDLCLFVAPLMHTDRRLGVQWGHVEFVQKTRGSDW